MKNIPYNDPSDDIASKIKFFADDTLLFSVEHDSQRRI